MKKILIIKTSSLGDIIHTFPALAYLKAKWPSCQIDWVVERPFADLVQAHPMVNNVICTDTRQWRKGWWRGSQLRNTLSFRKVLRQEVYDLIFDFQGNVKSGLITAQARGGIKVGFSRECVSEWPNCLFTHQRFSVPMEGNVREENLGLVQSFFSDRDPQAFVDPGVTLQISTEEQASIKTMISRSMPGTKRIMVCPGSQWQNKRITTGALIDFLTLLQPHLNCDFYLVWGSEEEKKTVEEVQTVPSLAPCSIIVDKMPLPVLQNLMDQMDLVIAMDSLPLHLAGTTRAATFSIFGPSSALKYKPHGLQHKAMQGGCPYKRTFDRRCPILRSCPTGSCTRALTGKQIFEEFCALE